jgi:toxin ParE1/3/4
MAKRIKIIWTPQAQEDLREIRDFIARDAPITAASYVRRLSESVNRLRTFPEGGSVVPEVGDATIREIFFGQYRIIYRVGERRVEILTVYHSARLLDGSDL